MNCDAAGQEDIPENGHRWTINVACRGASALAAPGGRVIDGSYRDCDHESEFVSVVIRAHGLHDALLRATRIPLQAFIPEEELETHHETAKEQQAVPTAARPRSDTALARVMRRCDIREEENPHAGPTWILVSDVRAAAAGGSPEDSMTTD